MKQFKDLLSEVAQPKSGEEQRFKDLHKVELIKHPVALDSQFTGEIEGVTKQKRAPDQEGDATYDPQYAVKDKPFKMPRDIDEEVEETVEEEVEETVEEETAPKSKLTFKGLIEKVVVTDEYVEEDFSEDPISEAPEYVSEDPQQEIPMMMRQLHFIAYAADEIMEDLADGTDPEEWYQNKLANTFSMMKSLYAYSCGKQAADKDENDLAASYIASGVYEETEVDEATAHRVGKSFSAMSGAGSQERDYIVYVDGDVHNPVAKYPTRDQAKKKRDQLKAQGKDAGFKDVKRRSTLKYQDQTPDPRNKKESVESESLEEATFKPGNLKLKNGDSVKIQMADAKVLSALMKGLNAKNRKEMEATLMKDKKGFQEILDFAKEAI